MYTLTQFWKYFQSRLVNVFVCSELINLKYLRSSMGAQTKHLLLHHQLNSAPSLELFVDLT